MSTSCGDSHDLESPGIKSTKDCGKNYINLLLVCMGYFDNLLCMEGGKKAPSGLMPEHLTSDSYKIWHDYNMG